MVLTVMLRAFLAERSGVGVEGSIDALQRLLVHAKTLQPAAERGCVRRFHRTVATVAAAIIGGTDRPAASVRHGAKTRRSMRNHHADIALELAFDAHAMRRHHRAPPGE